MTNRLRNYFSSFSPQFVRGVGVLAQEAQFGRRRFMASTRPLPNFFTAAKRPVKDTQTAARIRLTVWSAISIAWILTITALAFLRLNLLQIIVVLLIMIVPAPYVLLRVAAWCMPKEQKARRK